jgi:hypothetical protein
MAKKKKIEMNAPIEYKPESMIHLENDDCIDGVSPKETITATIKMTLTRSSVSTDNGKTSKSQTWKITSIETDGEESEDKEDKGDSVKKYGMGRSLK